MPTADTRTRGSRRASLVAVMAGLSVAVLAMLAVATNLATSAIPHAWNTWASDARITWGATGVLFVLAVLVGVVLQRLSSEADADAEDAAAMAAASPGRRGNNLRPRDPTFVGRNEQLAVLTARLAPGVPAVVAIHGLGGAGKSALALEFAHRRCGDHRYALVWWIRAESPVTLLEDLAAIAPSLNLRLRKDRGQTVGEVLARLREHGNWLLVFDNATEPDNVLEWLPGTSGSVLVTTRLRGWGKLATQIELAEFTRGESVEYLRRSVARTDPGSANELAAALGDLPLALAQSASYIDTHDISLAAYLKLYQERSAADGPPNDVATTWLLHYEELERDKPASLELLRLCSFLDPDAIDLTLVLASAELLPSELAAAAQRPLDLENAIGALTRTALVTRNDDRTIRLHRLVSEATRQHLGTDATAWADRAVKLIERFFPSEVRGPAEWSLCNSLSAHARVVCEHAVTYHAFGDEEIALRNRLSQYLHRQAGYEDAGLAVQSAYVQQARNVAPANAEELWAQEEATRVGGRRGALLLAMAVSAVFGVLGGIQALLLSSFTNSAGAAARVGPPSATTGVVVGLGILWLLCALAESAVAWQFGAFYHPYWSFAGAGARRFRTFRAWTNQHMLQAVLLGACCFGGLCLSPVIMIPIAVGSISQLIWSAVRLSRFRHMHRARREATIGIQ